MNIRIFTYGRGGQGALSVQKNEKIRRILHNFHYIFFLQWILKNVQKGGPRERAGWVEFFFYILLYYFINVMMKTLYISNFIVVYVIYLTHSLYYYVLMCFSLLPTNDKFFARTLSSPTFFDLDG